MVDSVLLAPRFERLQQRRCIGFRECFHATRLRALLSAPSCLFGFRNLVRLYRYQLAGDAPLTAAALERAMKGRGRRRTVRKGARPAAEGSFS